MIRTLATITTLAVATPALADPCEAPVTGYKPGQVISGLVWHGIDGDGLCVGLSPDPATWVEVRESRFFAPELNQPGGREAKRAMDRQVGKRAVCTVERGTNGATRSYDRVIASCRIEGRSVAEIMGAAGVAEGGRGFGR